MNAFLTGSHAYGTPREDSDIDVVVLMNPEDVRTILGVVGPRSSDGSAADDCRVSLRFGNLKLLVMVHEDQFRAWQEATEELAARRPVTRAEAIRVIDEKEHATYAATAPGRPLS